MIRPHLSPSGILPNLVRGRDACRHIKFLVAARGRIYGPVSAISMLNFQGLRAPIVFFLLFAFQLDASSQSTSSEEPPPLAYSVVVPPAPTAAALGKYGEYEVNMASGVPQISVPLTEIKNHSLSLPITLSYHAGGNRVDEVPSWVGLGWSLNAGGVITRTMQGNPDEDPLKGFLATGEWIQGRDQLTNADYQLAKDVTEGFADTSPDLFSYNFAGYSGKFYVDFQNNVHLIPYQPIQIIPFVNFSPSVVGFVIITEDGTKYSFAEEEKSDYQMGKLNFTSSWYLTSVESADGFDRIDLHYGNHPLQYRLQENIAKLYEFSGLDLIQSQRHISRSAELITVPQAKKLQSIDFKQGVVEFSWTASDSKEAQLNKIVVKSIPSSPVTTIDFNYSLYPKRGDCQSDECDRRRLDGVVINMDQFYHFTYDGQSFPSFDSYDRDHWGYYNAAYNSSPIPTYTTSYNESVGDGANRLPNATAMKIGILKEIQHPTGGVTKFEFEPNKFYYFDQPGGNRVEIEMPFTYQVTVTEEGTHILTRDFDWPGSLMPVDGPTFDDITWYGTTGYHVEFGTTPSTFASGYNGSPKFDLFNTGGFSQSIPLGTPSVNDFDPSRNMYVTTYTGTMFTSPEVPHTARLQTGDDVGNYVRVTLTAKGWYAADAPVTDDGHILVGGLRVKSINNYASDGTYLNGKTYTYEKAPGVSSAKLLTGSWEQYKSNHSLYMGSYNYELGCFDPSTPAKVILHDNPVAQLGASVAMYEKVRETVTGESASENGYTESTFEFWRDGENHLIYPHPPRMDEGWRRGQISGKKVYKNVDGGVPQLVKEEKYYYELSPSSHSIQGAKIVPNRKFMNDEAYSDSDMAGCFAQDWYLDIREFEYIFYNFISRLKYLKKQEIFDYYDAGVIQTDIDYTYTTGVAQLLRSKMTTVHNETKSVKEETIYPFDIGAGNTDLFPMASNLVNLHAIALPVERRTSQILPSGEQVVAAQLIKYAAAKPHEIYSLDTDIPIMDFQKSEMATSIDSRYGIPDYTITYSGSKVSDQIRRDGVRLKYLWNDGFNVSSETVLPPDGFVAHTSFEEASVSGGWSGVNISRQAGDARTGEWCGSLQTGSALNCTLYGAGKYILTFWVKSDVAITIEAGGTQIPYSIAEQSPSGWKSCKAVISASLGQTPVVIEGTALIDEVRIYPRGAQMTSYAHRPLVGPVSITDPNGETSYYDYDDNNRLRAVYDDGRNIEQLFDYRFKIGR